MVYSTGIWRTLLICLIHVVCKEWKCVAFAAVQPKLCFFFLLFLIRLLLHHHPHSSCFRLLLLHFLLSPITFYLTANANDGLLNKKEQMITLHVIKTVSKRILSTTPDQQHQDVQSTLAFTSSIGTTDGQVGLEFGIRFIPCKECC